MKSIPYAKKNPAKLVGIAGIARTGKALMGGFTSTFKGSEKINVNLMWELANQLNYTKQMNDSAAIFLLRRGFYTIAYNLAIGREVNSRPKEYSSISSYRDKYLYKSRIKYSKDGDIVFNKMKKKKFIVPMLIHDALVHSKILLKAFPSIKLIQMEKNPIELAYSWLNRNFGSKAYQKDRVGILTFKLRNRILPWYVYGWENKYLKLKEPDKIVYILEKLINKQNHEYSKLGKNKKRILHIFFEKFITEPEVCSKKIENFLGLKRTNYSKIFLKTNYCPRILQKKKYDYKKNFLKKKLSSETFKKLLVMEKNYSKKIKFKKLYI